MPMVKLARHAMATRFEMVLHGGDPVRLRAAGEEALDEIERLEAQLSLYRRTSEISQINARAAREPLRVEPTLFRLLQRAQEMTAISEGAFDITVAPLVRCWGFMGGSGSMPDPVQIAEARSKVGMHRVQLRDFTIQFEREGMMIDLGAIGKGYALDRAAEILIENGITSALLHGGTSTVYGIGAPPEGEWKVAIDLPSQQASGVPDVSNPISSPVAVVRLKDEALSVSAPTGKFFQANGKILGHVIDPRTGEPTQAAVLAAVVLPSAADSDALSTALLTLGPAGHSLLVRGRPGLRALTIARDPSGSLNVENHRISG